MQANVQLFLLSFKHCRKLMLQILLGIQLLSRQFMKKILEFLRQMRHLLVHSRLPDLVQMQILSSLLQPLALVLKILSAISVLHPMPVLDNKIYLGAHPLYLWGLHMQILLYLKQPMLMLLPCLLSHKHILRPPTHLHFLRLL